MPGETKQNIFVTGGCKSGKSAFAQSWVECCGSPRLYIATAEVIDTEMAERVRRHQKSRGAGWQTKEEPLDVAAVLREQAPAYAAVLLDCVTIWLANMQFHGYSNEQILKNVRNLTQAINATPCPVAVVSNEVGWGIVPENGLARAFRDLAGTCNQMLAAHMDSAVLLASGLPLVLKGTVRLPPDSTEISK